MLTNGQILTGTVKLVIGPLGKKSWDSATVSLDGQMISGWDAQANETNAAVIEINTTAFREGQHEISLGGEVDINPNNPINFIFHHGAETKLIPAKTWKVMFGKPSPPEAFGLATHVFRSPDLQTLHGTDSIRAFRLDPSVDRSTNKHPKFGGYPVLKESSLTNATFARAVAAALLAEEKFTPSGTRKCSFEPVVGFLISKGTNHLEALICFQCSEFAIRSGSGQSGYFLYFNTSAPRLLAVAKQAFPGERVFEPAKPPASRFE